MLEVAFVRKLYFLALFRTLTLTLILTQTLTLTLNLKFEFSNIRTSFFFFLRNPFSNKQHC